MDVRRIVHSLEAAPELRAIPMLAGEAVSLAAFVRRSYTAEAVKTGP